ncbi:glycoside hydrolase superfamily [Catenaria anguillulae PL171]|uniref:beta-N-acetylhexosaminidase n=1 Tax=Catenaria anguillulae PL171 TaxID=765915 RepID=A0A1Y2HY91_9FUNG|nr:glycoside hydrolase superfamily [Catenaria anguillulae PL171]
MSSPHPEDSRYDLNRAVDTPDISSSPSPSPDHARQASQPLVASSTVGSVRSRISPTKLGRDGAGAGMSSDTLRDDKANDSTEDKLASISDPPRNACWSWLLSPIALTALMVYALVMTGLFAWAAVRLAGMGEPGSSSSLPPPSPSPFPARPKSAAKAPIPVLPLPRRITLGTAAQNNVTLPLPISFALPSNASVFLQSTVSRYIPLVFPCTEPQSIIVAAGLLPATTGTVIVVTVHSADESLGVETNERYTLNTSQQDSRLAIEISAATVYGAMRALDTLAQLVSPISPMGLLANVDNSFLPTSLLPEPMVRTADLRHARSQDILRSVPLTIDDWPRVPHRGLLIDTSRHFIPLGILKRMVDGIAAAKMNVLHWHVSDAQSFPMRFDDVYMEKDVRDFVEYWGPRDSRIRHSWHTFSFSHAHPSIVVCGNRQPYPDWGASPPTGQLDPTNPATYDLIKRLATAVYRSFPMYVHWGHDEINANCWSNFDGGDTKTTLAKFHERLRRVLAEATVAAGSKSVDKKVIVWEEPFTHLGLETSPTPAENTTFHAVQLWVKSSPETLAAIQAAGKQAIVSDSNAWYLDCGQGAWLTDARTEDLGWCKYRSWQAVYAYDPFPRAILGGEVAMWTEQTDAANVLSKVFPRAFAFAERAWADPERDQGWDEEGKDVWEDATRRMSLARERIGRWRGVAAGPLQPEWCGDREADCKFG